jgi:hypothetical protein
MTSNTGLIDFSPRWIVSRGRSATSRKCPLPNRNIVVSPRLLLADFGKKKRAAWILEPSATGLCEADLHVFAKFLEDRLERGLEAQAFSGREIGGDDDILDFFVGHLVDVDLTRQPAS